MIRNFVAHDLSYNTVIKKDSIVIFDQFIMCFSNMSINLVLPYPQCKSVSQHSILLHEV